MHFNPHTGQPKDTNQPTILQWPNNYQINSQQTNNPIKNHKRMGTSVACYNRARRPGAPGNTHVKRKKRMRIALRTPNATTPPGGYVWNHTCQDFPIGEALTEPSGGKQGLQIRVGWGWGVPGGILNKLHPYSECLHTTNFVSTPNSVVITSIFYVCICIRSRVKGTTLVHTHQME